jgi:AcrR family transcriptional regulator
VIPDDAGPARTERDTMVRSDAARNREAVVVAAARLFRRDGATVSLEEIAREAGVGSATLHRHFRGRQALLDAVVLHDVTELCAAVDRIAAEQPPGEALWSWLELVATHCAADDALSALVRTGRAGSQSESWDLLAQAGSHVLDAAAAAGSVRPEVRIGELLSMVNAIAIAAGGTDPGRLVTLLRHGAAPA